MSGKDHVFLKWPYLLGNPHCLNLQEYDKNFHLTIKQFN